MLDRHDLSDEEWARLAPGEATYPQLGCIELSPGAVVTLLVRAYCEDFTAANPGPEDRLSVAGPVRGDLRKLFATLGNVPEELPSIPAVQVAVWVLTDDVTRSQLRNKFPVASEDIRAARALLQRAGINVSNRRLFQ